MQSISITLETFEETLMKKRILSLLLAAYLIINIILPATAANNLGGSCGRNLKWNLKNGTMTISGTGDMYEPEMALEEIPWYLNRELITTAIIETGVNSICIQAFDGCDKLVSIFIPSTITRIGSSAFSGCDNLRDVYYSGNESQWNSLLKQGEIELPAGVAIHFKNSGFLDVPADGWYAEPVSWAVAQGITTGTSSTTFSPNETCTNAQVITFIWRACGEPEPIIDNPFDDISEDKYYYEAALWAYANEMVTDSSFQASKPCTRSMAMTYLWKEAGSPGVVLDSQFTDINDNDDCALAVAWALEAEITDGTSDSTFSPATTCTRAHIITFLYRTFGEHDETESAPEITSDFLPIDVISGDISIPESNSDVDPDTDYLEITA